MLSLKGVKVFLLVLSILMIAVSYSHAVTVPQMINYSGTLNDINGNPVANGNYSMEFRIYDQASGGTALWSEKWDTTTSQVPVVNGTFNVMLGAIDKVNNPIPASFFAQYPTTYLGIKVGNDSEMLPRQIITSVGYALSAWNGVPKGGIIMWSGAVTQIPEGWALCDGTEKTAPDGTKVIPPNLRDRFIVGAGSGYAVNATGGEATHILITNEMPVHTHTQDAHNHGNSGGISATHTHPGTTGNDSPDHVHKEDDELWANNPGSKNIWPDSGGYWFNTTTAGGRGFLYTAGANTRHTHPFTTGTESVDHTHAVYNATATNQNVGGGAAHENRPPYYALAFIMKL